MYINVPVAAGAVLAGLPLLRNPRGTREAKLDVASTVAGCGGLTAAVGGFAAANALGWSDPRVLGLLATSVLLLALFTVLTARRVSPVLPLRILADRTRGGAFLAVVLSQVAMFGLFLFMTYYLQTILDYSPVQTGVAFVPLTAGIIAGSTLIAGRLLPRTGPRPLMLVALLVAALGMGLLTHLGPDTANVFLTHLLPAQILLGLGLGGVMMPAMSTATAGVAEHDAGAASATVNAAQQIGGSLGTALLNTIATTATTSYLASHTPPPLPRPPARCTASRSPSPSPRSFSWPPPRSPAHSCPGRALPRRDATGQERFRQQWRGMRCPKTNALDPRRRTRS